MPGDALPTAHALVPSGSWQTWLRDHCHLSERTARVYVQVAKARAVLARQSSAGRPLSIAAALAYLKDPGTGQRRKSSSARNGAAPTALSPIAWSNATLPERTRFLNGSGLGSVLAALPPGWRAEIARRVTGQRAGYDSNLGEVVTKAVRQALSLQLNAPKDAVAPGVANALNAILNRLRSVGLDLHDVEIVIRAASRKRAA